MKQAAAAATKPPLYNATTPLSFEGYSIKPSPTNVIPHSSNPSKKPRVNSALQSLFDSDKEIVESLFRRLDSRSLKSNNFNTASSELELAKFAGLADAALKFGNVDAALLNGFKSLNLELPEDTIDLFNSIIVNASKNLIMRSYSGLGTLYFPPNSRFLMSDITYTQPLVGLGPFDLIVMDPPWLNASVRRSSQYETLDCYDLFKVPIKQLSRGLVACWVTNSPKFIKFIKSLAFPDWELELVAEWYWIKVSESGDWIFDIQQTHRKPYERLLIGRKRRCVLKVPETAGIYSIPSSRHSEKPYLGGIFEEFLPQNALKLELFARTLHPGWTSWGNEVIKFNHADNILLV